MLENAFWPPSKSERSKILLWHASASPEHSKLLIGPASGPQSAMKCHSGRPHRDNIRRNRSKKLFKKPGSVTLHSAALLSASLFSCMDMHGCSEPFARHSFTRRGFLQTRLLPRMGASWLLCALEIAAQVYCSKVLVPVTLCSVTLALLHFATCMECTGSH